MTSSEPVTPQADAAGLPADPVRYRRKGLWVWFWLLIIFGFLCIGLGVYVAKFLPTIGAGPEKAALAGPALPWRTSSAEPAPNAVAVATSALPVDAAPSADAASLSARIAELEIGQARTLEAAATALAASALFQAAQTSRPFSAELAAVEPLMPASADLAELRRIAPAGAPTRAVLAAEFPDAASHAIAASRRPDSRASFFDRTRYALGNIVTIRRIDVTEGAGPHAVLARAEKKVGEGDIEAALRELDALPAAARDAMLTWRAKAERRAEVDRRLTSVREASLRTLRDAGSAT